MNDLMKVFKGVRFEVDFTEKAGGVGCGHWPVGSD